MEKKTCFVMQPFDGGKFDRRYANVFAPAIRAAGLNPYITKGDRSVEIPVEAIESGIRNASICLAEITLDNVNVFFEVGYALAQGKSVIFLCEADARQKYPFDMQHRTVITYRTEIAEDYEDLKNEIKQTIEARLAARTIDEELSEISKATNLVEVSGLDQPEVALMAIVGGDATHEGARCYCHSAKHKMEKAGYTGIAFGIATRSLVNKGLLTSEFVDEGNYEETPVFMVTDSGWDWIDANRNRFVLHKFDDIPF